MTDLNIELNKAEMRAWQSLAQRKFWMFGYWAARWVFVSQLIGKHNPSPFRELVEVAKKKVGEGG